MTLREYVDAQKEARGSEVSDHTIITELSNASTIGKTTLYNVLRGQRLSRYPLAVALSRATRGAVPVAKLLKEV